MLSPLYNPPNGVMRLVGFMSGSGSNIRRILERQRELEDSVYKMVVIFSDNAESNAQKIGRDFDVPVVTRDINGFHSARGEKKKNLLRLGQKVMENPDNEKLRATYDKYLALREEFDAETVRVLNPYNVSVAAYGGYMSIASPVLTAAFFGVNVHPADLSIERDGKRVYIGDDAVAKAINTGERFIYSSTHIVTNDVDCGHVLMISKPLEVNRTETSKQNQERLKEHGDLVIFPRTLEYIARGRYGRQHAVRVPHRPTFRQGDPGYRH